MWNIPNRSHSQKRNLYSRNHIWDSQRSSRPYGLMGKSSVSTDALEKYFDKQARTIDIVDDPDCHLIHQDRGDCFDLLLSTFVVSRQYWDVQNEAKLMMDKKVL